MEAMRGFGAFAICFTLLTFVWFTQYKFFRRYGLQDTLTVVLNLILLFVVLFYVYPLKFVFTLLVNSFTGHGVGVRLANGTEGAMIESNEQVATLMVIFSIGYFAVFSLFVLLYLHAYRKRKELDLTELEVFDTRKDIQESALMVIIAAISLGFALSGVGRMASLAGMTYMLLPIVMTVHGTLMGRQRKKIEERCSLTEGAVLESD
jgi:uncharacterized membrane protein